MNKRCIINVMIGCYLLFIIFYEYIHVFGQKVTKTLKLYQDQLFHLFVATLFGPITTYEKTISFHVQRKPMQNDCDFDSYYSSNHFRARISAFLLRIIIRNFRIFKINHSLQLFNELIFMLKKTLLLIVNGQLNAFYSQ